MTNQQQQQEPGDSERDMDLFIREFFSRHRVRPELHDFYSLRQIQCGLLPIVEKIYEDRSRKQIPESELSKLDPQTKFCCTKLTGENLYTFTKL